jgi:oxygen-independent coproporphyrinogen-3 oxidase
VYVHFPWCVRKCPYCDFLSVASDRADIPQRQYADSLIAELERRTAELGERVLTSIYIGGGTPSLFDPGELARVLSAVRRTFASCLEPLEVTLECNPNSFDNGRVWLDTGVNRVSIGVQSLDDDMLRMLGRLHDRAEALGSLRHAIESGFSRVSADLLFGLPDEQPAQAAAHARAVAELGVGHVSAYNLTIEPGTPFGDAAQEGRLVVPDDVLVAETYDAVRDALAALGFEHYEVSNYSLPGQRSRHNMGYWLGHDYLGLGCGAYGTVSQATSAVRYRNTSDVRRYLDHEGWRSTRLDTEGPLVASVEELDAETLLRERLMLGLRLADGFDIERVERELGIGFWTKEREQAADKLARRGDLEREGSSLRIPEAQRIFTDGISRTLM